MQHSNNIIVHVDKNMPLVHGECPSCKIGKHSLILVDFVPHPSPGESMVYMKCVGCSNILQTKVKKVVNEA